MMLPAMPLLMTPPSGGMQDPKQFVVFLAVYLGLIVIVLAPHYILNALGLYKIAARRGICHAWLAWVPLGDAWILGRISDQYQSLALQKQKKRGLILLLLQSTQCILYVLILVLFFTGLAGLEADATEVRFLAAMIPAIVVMLIATAGSIASAVFTYLAKYDLFRSCDPKNAVVYLAGCLIVKFAIPAFEILQPILVLLCSKKDGGMPQPQRDELLYQRDVGPYSYEE
jgi:hypothetical protein